MAQQIINNGDSGLLARTKINDNLTELYTSSDKLANDNLILVSGLSDLPTPVNGVITLEPKHYTVMVQLDLGSNRIDTPSGCTLEGYNDLNCSITSSNTSSTISASNQTSGSVFIKNLLISNTSPNGHAVSFVNSNTFISRSILTAGDGYCANYENCPITEVYKSITYLGARGINSHGTSSGITLEGVSCLNHDTAISITSSGSQIQILNTTVQSSSYGINIDGNWSFVSLNSLGIYSVTTEALRLGTSQIGYFDLESSYFSGLIGFSFAADSGNIINKGVVTSTRFASTVALLGGTVSDSKWNFTDNSGLEDTVVAGDMFLTNPQTITVSTQDTFYPVTTGWDDPISESFSFDPSGFLTYTREDPILVTVTCSATVEKTGGGSDEIEMRVAQNWDGSTGDLARSSSVTRDTNKTTIVSTLLVRLQKDDTIRPVFSNKTGTSNISVSNCSLTIA